MSSEKIEEINRLNDEEHQRQAQAFKVGYKRIFAIYVISPSKLSAKMIHVYIGYYDNASLRKRLPKIYEKYGYGSIAAFIRWCANQERLISNINDLEEERSDRKILSYTVKWKNIEWTFDCSKNDFEGHIGTSIDYPHYHFQMRIDGRQFINFNEFHVPFTDQDLFVLKILWNKATGLNMILGPLAQACKML